MAIGDTFQIESETFELLSGFKVVSNSIASGGAYLQAAHSGEQRASHMFGEAAGSYDLTLGYFDENDGASELSILLNGVAIDAFVWDADPGSNLADSSSFLTRTIAGVLLAPGDVIELVGTKDGGEPLRIDYLSITQIGETGPDLVGPVVQSAVAPDLTLADAGMATTTVTVTYSDPSGIDASNLDIADIVVTGPSGALAVPGLSVDQPQDGTPRTVTYTLAAPGGSWDAEDNGSYVVALAGSEVFDTLGNTAPATNSIATFTVNISDAPPPSDPVRIEAETFTLVSGFKVKSNSAASGGAYLQAGSSDEQRAAHIFGEAAGSYDLTLGYFDENDGASQLSILLNGVAIDAFVWDADPGSNLANSSSFVTRIIADVLLAPDDVIELVGTKDGGEPLRIDYLEYVLDGNGGPPPDTSGPNISAANGTLTEGETTTGIAVNASDPSGVAGLIVTSGAYSIQSGLLVRNSPADYDESMGGVQTETVEITATDTLGNLSTAFATVTILDDAAPPSAVALGLYDADTDTLLATIIDGLFVNPSLAIGRAVNIVAIPTDPDAVESIGFNLDFGAVTGTENVAPYALFGDSGGDLSGGLIGLGPHTLMVSGYSENRLGGTQVFSQTVAFTVGGNGGGSAPTDIVFLPGQPLVENATGVIAGTLSVTDPDAGDTHSFLLSDPRFEVVGTQLKLKDGIRLDYELGDEIDLDVTAIDPGGLSVTRSLTVSVADVDEVRFAAFGDYMVSPGMLSMVDLIDGMNVDFIITTGDNGYALTIDDQIGPSFSDYIGNYSGAYGPGSEINRFFPSLGNHDYSDVGLDAYLDYVSLPGNERYYDFQMGPIHFFALNSNSQEPDGRSSTSDQAQWLETELANSDALYKIVYFHHAPYSSGIHGSNLALQWPFEDWGVTAVLTGHDHDYERILRDDNGDGEMLPYFVTGLGGRSIRDFDTPIPGSEARYNDDYGTMLVQASDATITFEFWSIADGGTLIDSYTIDLPGADPLLAGTADLITGGPDNDSLNGLAADNQLFAQGGDGEPVGGVRDDAPPGNSGNSGSDWLFGQAGADVFHFTDGSDGSNFIADFEAGIDVIRFENITNVSDFGDLGFAQSGPDTVITLDALTVTLRDFDIEVLGPPDFVFV